MEMSGTITKKEMITILSYKNLFSTMEKKGITKYKLIFHYGISASILDRLSHDKPVRSTTLNDLCTILDCNIEDVVSYVRTDEEVDWVEKKKAETREKYHHTKEKG